MAKNDQVVREFNALGQTKIRLILNPHLGPMLDLDGAQFNAVELRLLQDVIGEALALMNAGPHEKKRGKTCPASMGGSVARDRHTVNSTAMAAACALAPRVGPREIPSDPRTFPDAPLDEPEEREADEESQEGDESRAQRRSCLPPALLELRKRMHAGETVEHGELFAALRTMRPLEAPTRPSASRVASCSNCSTMGPVGKPCDFCGDGVYAIDGYCRHCGGATEVDGVTECLSCRDAGTLERMAESDAEEIGDMGREDF
jgi:hypothetical protein